MKLKSIMRAFMLILITCSIAAMTSCKKSDPETPKKGTIIGIVKDTEGTPVAGVTVALGTTSVTATTAIDGSYILDDVDMSVNNALTFTKTGYLTVSITVRSSQFDEKYVATANVSMEFAGAKIIGKVTDASNGGVPMEGVSVSISASITATTASDGAYAIENLPIEDYTVTFSKGGYSVVAKNVLKSDFVEGIATVNAELGAKEVLRGKTADNLRNADKWLYSDYRGGRNGDDYPHFDWSVDFLCTFDFQGWWEEQNEGSTLQIRNSEEEGHWNNPADLDIFDSYVFGSKMITEDNKIMTLLLRTHAATEELPAVFGVQVVDLSASDPVAVKIGENQTLNSEDYVTFEYDLSSYVGKEVVIAVGIYRAQTGDYWKQLVIRRIAFSNAKIEGFGWHEGTPVNDEMADWKLTREMINSTMIQEHNTLFTGISPVGGDRDNYKDGYRSWKDVHHIGYDWTLVPRYKDAEPLAGEGFLIKTNGGGTAVNTIVPQAYLYGKFNINANTLVIKARNFNSECATFFKLTAIDATDFSVTNLVPVSASTGEAAADGCWKFINEQGGQDDPEAYAEFTYDISALNGKTAVLALGVYKGESNDAESKFAIYSVEMK